MEGIWYHHPSLGGPSLRLVSPRVGGAPRGRSGDDGMMMIREEEVDVLLFR